MRGKRVKQLRGQAFAHYMDNKLYLNKIPFKRFFRGIKEDYLKLKEAVCFHRELKRT